MVVRIDARMEATRPLDRSRFVTHTESDASNLSRVPLPFARALGVGFGALGLRLLGARVDGRGFAVCSAG
jgi:hypothetical protein